VAPRREDEREKPLSNFAGRAKPERWMRVDIRVKDWVGDQDSKTEISILYYCIYVHYIDFND
jgi:hypothetical protein